MIRCSLLYIGLLCAGSFVLASCNVENKAIEKYYEYGSFDAHYKYQPLNDIYPYKEYVGKEIYLHRNTPLWIESPTNHTPFRFFLDGDTNPAVDRNSINEICINLPKGLSVRILNIYSEYRKLTSRMFVDNSSQKEEMRNTIIAEIELDIPSDLEKRLRLKERKIMVSYCWTTEGGILSRRTFVTPYLRRAPWEPDIVPSKRYVGVMGNEYPQPQEQK